MTLNGVGIRQKDGFETVDPQVDDLEARVTALGGGGRIALCNEADVGVRCSFSFRCSMRRVVCEFT